MAGHIMPNSENRTLYVGNLDHNVKEDLIQALFSQLGEVRSCKMFREPTTDPYCFVEFNDHVIALNAISMMNDKMLQGRKMRVDWATGQGNKTKYTKIDTTNHFHIYVGDLSPEIDEQALKEAFQVFGEISDCKVVKDPQNFKSRGYGFVVFVKKMDAETAITNMNGQWLGRKMIKARWATRKPNTGMDKPENRKLSYHEVFNQTTPTNTTVFCGGLKNDVDEETLQTAFSPFGIIEKIKIFKEKGYAFIKYSSKDKACQAIVEMHNSSLNGQLVRCSWGKDTGPDGPSMGGPDMNGSSQPQPPHQPPFVGNRPPYNGQQMSFWGYYPQQQMGYNQMGYNQYYGYQPNPGYMWMGWGQQGGQGGWGGDQQGPPPPGQQPPPPQPPQPPQPPAPQPHSQAQ